MRTSESSATLIGVPEGTIMATVSAGKTGVDDSICVCTTGGRGFNVCPAHQAPATSKKAATQRNCFERVRIRPIPEALIRQPPTLPEIGKLEVSKENYRASLQL